MLPGNTKFRISIKELSIEFEGAQATGQQIHQGVTQAIGGLMNASDRLLTDAPKPKEIIDGKASDFGAPKPNGHVAQDINGEKPNGEKPKQSRPRRTKGGPSIASLLLNLKQEGYFSQARTSGEVLSYLRDCKAHTLAESNVRAELSRMVKRDDPAHPAKLHRTKKGSKNYIYKDTPFDEGERSPSPAEELAE